MPKKNLGALPEGHIKMDKNEKYICQVACNGNKVSVIQNLISNQSVWFMHVPLEAISELSVILQEESIQTSLLSIQIDKCEIMLN